MPWLENRLNRKLCALIDPKATSDDKPDSNNLRIKGQKVYYIKQRKEQSAKAENFTHILKCKCEEAHLIDGKCLNTCRIEFGWPPLENQKDSEFLALLSGLIPIDYYDLTFFNSQQPCIHNWIASLKISFLPDVNLSFTMHPDERLDDMQFQEKYGGRVMARYTLNNLEDGEWINDEVDDNNMDGLRLSLPAWAVPT